MVEGNKEKPYSRKSFKFYALFNNKGELLTKSLETRRRHIQETVLNFTPFVTIRKYKIKDKKIMN